MNDLQRLNLMFPKGAKLDDIITAIVAKGGTVAEPQKVADIVNAVNAIATWDADLIGANILLNKNILGVAGSFDPNYWYVGDTVVYASDTLYSWTPSGWGQSDKWAVVNRSGVVRVSYTMQETGGSQYNYSNIYKNGAPVGTQRSVKGTTTTFTEDIPVTAGDSIAIYGSSQYNNNIVKISNFKLKSLYNGFAYRS